MSFGRRTESTTGKKSKSKSRIGRKAPASGSRTQRQSAKPNDRITHDITVPQTRKVLQQKQQQKKRAA